MADEQSEAGYSEETDQEIILRRARTHAAHYSRSRGRHDEADRIERGEADDVPLMQVLVGLLTDPDGTPAEITILS